MADLRRSGRLTTKAMYFDKFSPSYPDEKPANDFERRVASLDQQSFPYEQFSVVDDILVYALFGSKRRTKGYRTIKIDRAFGEEDSPVTPEQGIQIRQTLGSEGLGWLKDIHHTALSLVSLPNIFSMEHLHIVEQYAVHTI
jgi:hypothetical protein